MKRIIFALLLTTGLVAHAAGTKQDYVQGYATEVFNKYTAATNEAIKLNDIIQAFVTNPTPELYEAAKIQWIAARKVYSVTEVYRFYDGPIDGGANLEGQINAWPLDEVYIDYVDKQPNAGIINNVAQYPDINMDLLEKLNGLDGEANVATGWHAIEFLLWGQDLPNKKDLTKAKGQGPGEREFTDYLVSTKGPGINAQRRATYLSVVSTLLVKNLAEVTAQWDPAIAGNYVATFLADVDGDMFDKVIGAAKFLASDELAVERMLVAYDLRDQEHEHSCFSDTTTNDIYYNFVGIKNVLTETYNGTTFLGLVAAQDQAKADAIAETLASLEVKFLAFPGPFDEALVSPTGRVAIKAIVDELNLLGQRIGEGTSVL